MKKCVFYFLIISINLMPFILLSIKGILGLIFIIFSSIKYDFKETIRTTIIVVILGEFSYIMDFSVDYEHGLITLFIGTLSYFIIAYLFGSYAEKVRNMLKQLSTENEIRRNIETELKQKIVLQNIIINTIPTPLYFKDLKFNYVGINPAYSELIGINEKDIIGKNVFDLFDTHIAESCNQMDIDLINDQCKQIVKEISILLEDGNSKTIINSKALILDDEGNPSGIVGVLLDITGQKESEILKTNIAHDQLIIDELKRDEALKTEFFSNISHELRTPLNVIFSAVQLVETYANTDYISNQNKIIKNIKSIKQNSLRLQRLVNNLIDITKIDSHAFEIKLQNLDIVNVVEEITLSVSDFISNKGILLVFDTNVEEKIMAFDEEKFERIILNLLSNAIKYTQEGGTINVNIIDKGENVIIQIKDSGIGIPQDKLDLVFNRFYQISPM
ncbi:MAG TPA: ATP-binding protein, partial [Patescibacteria group bacterium]|nr:ATP-binding protein [Patescibacteria group bacterium]